MVNIHNGVIPCIYWILTKGNKYRRGFIKWDTKCKNKKDCQIILILLNDFLTIVTSMLAFTSKNIFHYYLIIRSFLFY